MFAENYVENEYGPSRKRYRSDQTVSSSATPDVSAIPVLDLLEELPLKLELKRSQSLLDMIETLSIRRASNTSQKTSGLQLTMSPSLLDLMEAMCSDRGNETSSKTSGLAIRNKESVKGNASANTNNKKPSTSTFSPSRLRIGSWEHVPEYVTELVAKFYHRTRKLIWEIGDGTRLTDKMEIPFSDIVALKPDFRGNNGCESLTIVLTKPPIFFRAINQHPGERTRWEKRSDFTNGQATTNRIHYIECGPAELARHYKKLIEHDSTLYTLSQHPEKVLCSPYFEAQVPVEHVDGSTSLAVHEAPSVTAAAQLSPFYFRHNRVSDHYMAQVVPSDVLAPSFGTTEGMRNVDEIQDNVSNNIFGDVTGGNLPSYEAAEWQNMEDFLEPTQETADLDENSVMEKVNSLSCLLTDAIKASDAGDDIVNVHPQSVNYSFQNIVPGPANENGPGLQREDSYSELLDDLPRVASLPKIFTDEYY